MVFDLTFMSMTVWRAFVLVDSGVPSYRRCNSWLKMDGVEYVRLGDGIGPH